VLASRPAIAASILLVEATDDLRCVPCGSGPLRILHVLRFDRDAAAVVIEIGKRIVLEPIEQIPLDRKRPAALAVNDQTITRARRANAAELDVMHVLTGTRVAPEDSRLAGRDVRAARIDESPIERRGQIALHDRALRSIGFEPELIEADARQLGWVA